MTTTKKATTKKRAAKKTPANNKTVATKRSVAAFLRAVEHPQRRADCQRVVDLMQDVTGLPPTLWGNSIIGFGSYHYVYDSGREGDMPLVGVSPRKQNLVLYIMPGFEQLQALAGKLGKHKVGKSCLYINKLADVDEPTLVKMIEKSVQIMRKRYKV